MNLNLNSNSNSMTKKPSRFAPANAYAEMKARVIEKLKAFCERFSGMSAD